MTLVDTSVWIDAFRGGESAALLKSLLDSGEVCVNDIVLTELLPSIRIRGESELEALLLALPRTFMSIDWSELVQMQSENLKHGLNKVGLPDLMIAQNAMQNGLQLCSLDRHFRLMAEIMPLSVRTGD